MEAKCATFIPAYPFQHMEGEVNTGAGLYPMTSETGGRLAVS